ncbi:hypothetical protein [Xanthobacter sediminis]
MDEIHKKELGPFSHFLDGIWRNFSVAAAGTLVIAGAWAAVMGEFAVYMLPISILVTQLASGAYGLREWRRAERWKRIYDTPRCQDYLRSVEDRARGVVASQRGTVWVVMDPDSLDKVSQVRILSDREYQRFRAQGMASGRPMDEVRIREGGVVGLTQVREGREHFPRSVDLVTGRTMVMRPSGRIERWTKEGEEHARGVQRGTQRRMSTDAPTSVGASSAGA